MACKIIRSTHGQKTPSGIRQKRPNIRSFTLYVGGAEVYDQDKAEALEAELKPLVGGPPRNEDVQVRYGSGPQPTAAASGTEVTMSVCGRVAEIQRAMAMRSASRPRKPMTCTPMGRVSTASKGSDAAGLRKYELTTAKAALPVGVEADGGRAGS